MGQSMPESGWTVKIAAKARASNRRCRSEAGSGSVLLPGMKIEDTPVPPRGLSRSRTSSSYANAIFSITSGTSLGLTTCLKEEWLSLTGHSYRLLLELRGGWDADDGSERRILRSLCAEVYLMYIPSTIESWGKRYHTVFALRI